MRIAIDIDDVLARFNHHFLAFLEERYGLQVRYEDLFSFHYEDSLGLDSTEVWARLEAFFGDASFHEIAPVLGAVEAVEALRGEHELFVLTSRHDALIEATLQFLERHFSKFYCEVIFTGQVGGGSHRKFRATKATACVERNIQCLIEDHIDYARDCAAVGVQVFLMDTPWNRNEPLGENMRRVHSWEEALKAIRDYSSAMTSPASAAKE